jgi:hypothetical protein
MKRTTFRRLTLALGILALVASVCSQLFHIQTTKKFSEKAVTEETDNHETDNHEEEVYVSVNSTSLPAAHVELNRDVFFLFETLFSEEKLDEAGAFHDIPVTSLIDALIGSFISPNAP